VAIVTISRGTFSGGKMLAECLSRKLGYACIDRDALVRKAATRRVSEYDLRAALEEPPDFPGRLNHKRYVYLALIQAALTEQVRGGRAVYHGLAGHLLLKGAPCLLRLRIIAPLEFRIAMAKERLNFTREEAVAHIESTDRDRRRWTQFLYGADWVDASSYDLVINLDHIGVDQACGVVSATIAQGGFEWSTDCQARMDDLALASRVRAELSQDLYTLNLEVEVSCARGHVSLRGDSLEDDTEAIQRVVRAVPGVKGLLVHDSGGTPQKIIGGSTYGQFSDIPAHRD
jgi:cytidylate kinase